jgi:hypothetical protein
MQNKLTIINKSFGLSLVELMVAMTVSAILMLGISEIFSINTRSYKVQDESARMQESGRYAFNILMTDIRRAGYFGGSANISEITGSLGISVPGTNCLTTDTTWARMIQRPFYGLNNTNAGYACIPTADMGSDVLVTRYTKSSPVTIFDSNRLYIRNSMFSGRLFIGADQAVTVSNDVPETPKDVHELAANAYYVGASGRTCRFNDATNTPIPIPALHRVYLSNLGRPINEEVASGIEQIQFQYGIDVNADYSVNQYVDANALSNDETAHPNWTEVVTVRLWVLVRADCPTNGYTNTNTYTMGDITYTPLTALDRSFKRQLYSTTVAVRN